MSIILDALKKAEGSQVQTSQGSGPATGGAAGTFKTQQTAWVRGARPSNKRTIVLLVVTLLVVGGFVAWKLGPKISLSLPFLKPKVQKQAPLSTSELPTMPANIQNPAPTPVPTQATDTENKIKELQTRATTTFTEGKYDESVEAYQKLMSLIPSDATVYNNYGVVLKKLGKIDEAKNAYQTALALSPEHTEALNNLAVIEIAQRHYNEARNILEKVIVLKPDYVDPYFHLGLCLERLGDTERAMTMYQKFLEISEGTVDRRVRLQVETRLQDLKE